MLGLLKESDRQVKHQKELLQKERNLVLQDKFRQLERERNFMGCFPSDKNERNKLQNAARSHREQFYEQSRKLCKESLDGEIGESRLDKEREQKIRQLLWKTAPELQNLRKMILVADVSRNQALQMAEKSALRQLEREEKELSAEVALKEKAAMEAEEKEKELRELKAKQKYHQELDELLRFKRAQESCDGGEAERAAIDEMKKKMEEEMLNEARLKIEKQKELRSQMLELQRVREEMRFQEKVRDMSESAKVDEYRRAQELRAVEQDERRRLELEQRLQVQEELLDFLEQSCREKLKWEELRTELAMEERELEEEERSREEEMKRKKLREDLQRVYDMQLRVRKQRKDLQKKEDELFRENMMRELYEQDKLELMGAQKKRKKQLEHKRAVEALLKENHLKKALEKSREMADQEHLELLEAERARMINEERIRFLKEHASDLLGYLPKGILRDTETVELLGKDFKRFYSHTPLRDEAALV